jgi:hypothetical protein
MQTKSLALGRWVSRVLVLVLIAAACAFILNSRRLTKAKPSTVAIPKETPQKQAVSVSSKPRKVGTSNADDFIRKETWKATDDMQRQLTGEKAFMDQMLVEVKRKTLERLADTTKPQTVWGKVDFHKEGMLSGRGNYVMVYAYHGRDLPIESAIINGAFSMGQLETGNEYMVFVPQSANTPAMKRTLNVEKGQASQEIAFSLGKCSMAVQVLDEDGKPLTHDQVVLQITGRSEERGMWREDTGIRDGLWRVKHFAEDSYLVCARLGQKSVSRVFRAREGENQVTLAFSKERDNYVMGDIQDWVSPGQ